MDLEIVDDSGNHSGLKREEEEEVEEEEEEEEVEEEVFVCVCACVYAWVCMDVYRLAARGRK